jgi:hypothetical protein
VTADEVVAAPVRVDVTDGALAALLRQV